MSDQWTDKLSDYLDDELTARERQQIEAHLAHCDECRTILGQLRAVVGRAATLPSSPPSSDLWPGVEARLQPSSKALPFRARAATRVSFTLPQLVAAGLALMVLSGGAVWLSQFGGRTTSLPPVAAAPTSPEPAVTPVGLTNPRYDEAVRELEDALDAGRSQLDPETVKILESNLQAIDQAIDQSRRALEADPANGFLYSHLAEARQRKLALLRRASLLVGPKG
jgi:anti-sigma factor RsiW